MRVKLSGILIAALIALAPAPARADVVILNDGTMLNGSVIQEADGTVVLYTGKTERRIPKGDVKLLRTRAGTFLPDATTPVIKPEPIPAPRRLPKTRRFNDEASLKLSFNAVGKHTLTATRTIDRIDTHESLVSNSDPSTAVAAEYILFFDWFGAGAGVEVQLPRGMDNRPGTFGFIPAYVLLKARTTPNYRDQSLYLTLHAGYDTLAADNQYKTDHGGLGGGMYYAMGVGATFGRLSFELRGAQYHASIDADGMVLINEAYREYQLSGDIDYTVTALSVAYSF